MEKQQFTIEDLHALQSIVEIACSRGAFHAPEMTLIGTVYDKLVGFLSTQNPPAEQQPKGDTENVS
jgi:hypothetical protein